MHVLENESLSKNATCQAQRIGQINKQWGAAQNLVQLPVGAIPSSSGAATAPSECQGQGAQPRNCSNAWDFCFGHTQPLQEGKLKPNKNQTVSAVV